MGSHPIGTAGDQKVDTIDFYFQKVHFLILDIKKCHFSRRKANNLFNFPNFVTKSDLLC